MKHFSSILILIILLMSVCVESRSAGEAEARPKKFAIITPTDSIQLQALLRQKLLIDSVTPLEIKVWVTDEEFKWIENQGWSIRWIAPLPDDFWSEESLAQPKALTYPLQSYPTYEQVTEALQSFASTYPDLCQVETIGISVGNRELWFLKVTDHPSVEEDEPEVKLVSTIHGNEPLGTVLTLNLCNHLLSGYGQDPRLTSLVNETELWIMPLMNPDGYTKSPRSRFNNQGIDLNRDFPDRVEDPHNTPTGRQPETQAIMEFGKDHTFVLSANFHTGSLLVNYPYDNSFYLEVPQHPDWYTPDNDVFIENSLAYSRHNPPMYASPYFSQGISNGIEWYAISGGMQDWNYAWLRCMEVTIEISDTFAPPTAQLVSLWNENRESMLAYIERAHTGIRGLVRDAQDGHPLPARIEVQGRDQPVFTDPEVGDYHRLLLPGTYSLTVSAEGYQSQTITDVPVTAATATRRDLLLNPNRSLWLLW
jgi:carboxypeptidase D